jgi:hypothetical protein
LFECWTGENSRTLKNKVTWFRLPECFTAGTINKLGGTTKRRELR